MSQLELDPTFAVGGDEQVGSDEQNDSTPPSTGDKATFWRHRWVYVLALGFILFVSFIFQIGNLGWIKIIFGLLYLFAFCIHTLYWMLWLGAPGTTSRYDRIIFIINNLLFLVGNVLNADFGDTSSYMFFMQYTDPPEALVGMGLLCYMLWFGTLLIDLIARAVKRANK